MNVSKEPRKIRAMFGAIAHRYDLLNLTLSLAVDRWWRWVTARRLRPYLRDDLPVLDLCTGTGDLALALSRYSQVVGCDFTHGMLMRGVDKVQRRNLSRRVRFAEGDALRLPFPDSTFAAVSIAFGLRNLESYPAGLREMQRVLRPGGALAVLECSQPSLPVFKQIFLLYFNYILPRVGRLVSGDAAAYAYLPSSVEEFPRPGELSRVIEDCGFQGVRHRRLTGGVACLHLAEKPATG
ncbi:MAG TPA: bifunctional demethylmenaquinone methyltransferase/2-methoxy-6-polyprenyl-1,4-benzoquinol methylase UbiE [Acidobacteriota bacterium]|nr:bifunctional demethylmenaquinone methyltransferase/2-methoxy-6-polyprenyl-1,4-benzoquinol methylase UbiE [Acidobacteriota bacterium]